MHLKQIELIGFKSFADKTQICFERGVTSIVGPNGCGKSNISDAMRWVLGERSAKLLRGTRMDDIIFAGTDFRKPVHFAEVSLTIDNSEHKLPIQYDEVVLTRRLDRSGESEYLINRTPCRLKDIQNLILDTGIGSNSYSMIEQGRIDSVVNSDPDARQFLIEEAAGISKYKVKKEEAVRKLEHTEQNLTRLNDIIAEVERNIRYAERQARKAERYKEQLDQLKTLEIRLSFYHVGTRQAELNAIATKRAEIESELSTLESSESAQSDLLNALDERSRQLEEKFIDSERERSTLNQVLAGLESKSNFNLEKIALLKSSREKARTEIASLGGRAQILSEQIASKRHELSRQIELIERIQAQKAEKEHLSKSRGATTRASAQGLAEQKERLFELARQISNARNRLHQTHAELNSLSHGQKKLEAARIKLTEEASILGHRHEKLQQENTIHAAAAHQEHDRLKHAQAERGKSAHEFEAAKEQLINLNLKRTELDEKLNALERINQIIISNDAQTAALKTSKRNEGQLGKTLMSFLEVKPGYELAVEAALSDAAKALVVEDLPEAVRLLDELTAAGSSQATIFILDQAHVNGHLTPDRFIESHPLVEAKLWNVIRVKPGCEGIFGNLLGNAYVVHEISGRTAPQLAELADRAMLVSKSGTLIGPRFQLSLRNGKHNPEHSIFARRKEVERLRTELKAIDLQGSAFATDRDRLEQELAHRDRAVQELEAQCRSREQTLRHVDGLSTGLEEQKNRLSEEQRMIELEQQDNGGQIRRLTEEEDATRKMLVRLEQDEEDVQTVVALLQAEVSAHESGGQTLQAELAQITERLNLQDARRQDIDQNLSFLEKESADCAERVQTLEQECDIAQEQVRLLSAEFSDLDQQKVQLCEKLERCSASVDTIRTDRSTLDRERSSFVIQLRERSKESEAVRQQLHELSLSEMKLSHQNEAINQELKTRYRISLAELRPEDFVLAPDEVQAAAEQINVLKEKLEGAGPVNLLAIDEFNEMKERFDFLNTQRQDLISARDSLLEAIRKINRTTRTLFQETYARVREAFQEYFRVLFKGGHADLVLLDEENLLDSGLDLIARPPGKKMQHISLLSGGEKALTAIALLLALFSVKPSPFCVLDEVDAPLDEANNDRFLAVLKPFLSTTQFIIVTHSRKTIAMADVLYGVTMEEPGISKLVSVRLAQDSRIEHSSAQIEKEINEVLK